jgi:hypothetical protein
VVLPRGAEGFEEVKAMYVGNDDSLLLISNLALAKLKEVEVTKSVLFEKDQF